MKKIAFLSMALSAVMLMSCGGSTKQAAEETDTIVYEEADVNPVFPGDVTAWLGENIKYPESCVELGIQGRVVASFVVDADGKVCDIEIESSSDEAMSAEAKRVLESMPAWTPGQKDGKEVRVRFHLPIAFTMVYDEVDINPIFPGDVFTWLSENIQYPESCIEQNIQGRVVASFVVGTDGSISEVEIEQSPDEALSAEAKRVIESMPAWTPGQKDGKEARVRYHLPIVFSLD